jgi:hypothetical protein
VVFIAEECLYLGIAGTYIHDLMLTFKHPLQAVGAALFIFYN